MDWDKADIGKDPSHSILNNFESILVRNDNLKPAHIKIPAENTEVWIRRGKKNLLLNIGESWAYGEGLENIATETGKFDLCSQLKHTFGPKLALLMDTDFYQYAVPGNSNLYMLKELERILPYIVEQEKYENIYLCMQVTEPSRELQQLDDLSAYKHPLGKLYNKKFLKSKSISFDRWLDKYDKIVFNCLEEIIKPYTNVKTLVWKNFCRIIDTNKRSFKKVDESWIKFSAKINGVKLEMPDFYVAGWLDHIMKDFREIKYNSRYVSYQLDLIAQSNSYLGNCPQHKPHPNDTQHSLWALNLYTEWNNG